MSTSTLDGPWEIVASTVPDLVRLYDVPTGEHIGTVERKYARAVQSLPDLLAAVKNARQLIDELGASFPDADEKFNGTWAMYREEFDRALQKGSAL